MSKKEFVVGLDIGTTKICCLVGEIVERLPVPAIDIVGIGTAPSRGLQKGVVVNIDHTVESITKAVKEAERMAGIKISTVYVGIAGEHIQSFNSTGVVAVKEKEITSQDVNRVIEAAKAIAIPLDRETIHVIPQVYKINDQDGIQDPIGMSGIRLEAKVHIVTAAVSSAQNLIKCANKAGLNVAEICLEPLASSEAVLCQDEKDLGVILVDIGGGTSDIAIFKEGAVIHTSVLALGGDHITNDIAKCLSTPKHEAEKIKIKEGSCFLHSVKSHETIEVAGIGGRKPCVFSKKFLKEVIELRVKEMFEFIHREIMKSDYQKLPSTGVVITGGASLLEGMLELAAATLQMPL